MIKYLKCLICFAWLVPVQAVFAQEQTGWLQIEFRHVANNRPLVLGDSGYTNSAGEIYQVSRLKYYLSNFAVDGFTNPEVYLQDAAEPAVMSMKMPAGKYDYLDFCLGVDSALNCSGAQAGSLDPLNGMFWTWNSGYIFFKLEGFSSASNADLHRIEHHIGGYRLPYLARAAVHLVLPRSLSIQPKGTSKLVILVNLDKYWNGTKELSIAENPLIMKPGEEARLVAANFPGMFSVK